MSFTDGVEDWEVGPAWGELRYSAELARLLSDPRVRSPRRREDAVPVMLIPGFMAGDLSLTVMRTWLGRRGHQISMSGIRANVDCSGRMLDRLELRLTALVEGCERPAVVIGQSRGGALARVLAVRRPDLVCGLAMLGTPVQDALAVSAPVLRTVRWMARLGDFGLPGVFSTDCRDGECCAEFRAELTAPLDPQVRALAVYSRSDAVVAWRTCLDDHAELAEVDSSHCGMSVHADVYRALESLLDESAAERVLV